MRFNKLNLVLLFLVKIIQIKGQNEELNCVYSQSYYVYSCDLTIQNPNGLNNFQDISGTHINGKSDNDVQYIIFNYDKSSSNIPSIICEKFQNIQYFDIYGATEINDYSLNSCIKLKSLNVGGNIKKINKNAFIENVQLETLSISGFQLTTLPVYVFPKSGNILKILRINNSKINALKPEWFKTLTNLENLSLDFNEIEEIPFGIFVPLRQLVSFSMTDNKLYVISSKSFFNVSQLREYQFNNNLIDAIDESFLINSQNGINGYSFFNNFCMPFERYTTYTIKDFKKCIENYRAYESGKINNFGFNIL